MKIIHFTTAEQKLNRLLETPEDVEKAAVELLSHNLEISSLLITGLSFGSSEFNYDYWRDQHEAFWLTNKGYAKEVIATENLTNNGMHVEDGLYIKESIVMTKMYINQHYRLTKYSLDNANQLDLPFLSNRPLLKSPISYPSCDKIGLYPIVDKSAWIKKLLPLGVKTIQLRIKDKSGIDLENEIRESILLAKLYHAKLFINDYWEIAIKYNAYGIHLGQEDLNNADLKAIHAAKLRLGISTHCYYEVARAHAIAPSYLACGPIFATTTKQMPFLPQGVRQLARWQKMLDYPLVAIGGITLERLPTIIATGVEGFAVLSAITQAPDPLTMTRNMLKIVR